jgi:hypothetical protein
MTTCENQELDDLSIKPRSCNFFTSSSMACRLSSSFVCIIHH